MTVVTVFSWCLMHTMRSKLRFFDFLRFVRPRSRPYRRVFGRPIAHFAAFFALFPMETLPKPQNLENAFKILLFAIFLIFSRKSCIFQIFFKSFQFFLLFARFSKPRDAENAKNLDKNLKNYEKNPKNVQKIAKI